MSRHSWRDRAGTVAFLLVLPVAVSAQDWRVVSEAVDGSLLRLEVRLPPPLRLEQDLDGVQFTSFHVPDASAAGSPGAPDLPVLSRLLALPPGGEASLQVLEVEADDEEDVRILPRAFEGVSYGEGGSPEKPSTGMAETWLAYDAAAYVKDGPRTQPATLGPSGMLRHQRVARLEVWPILYDPQTRHLRIVRRLVLEVRFRGARAVDPQAALAFQLTPRPWQQIYDAVLLNDRSARRWLQAPRRAERLGKPLASGMLRPGLLNEEQWKIRAGSTGPLRVPAAVLLDAGFPDGTPIDRLRLVLQRFDPAAPLEPRILEIPLQMEDDGDGLFRLGDSFVFYAEHPRDDATAGEHAANYSATNVYWLSVTLTGIPARMPVRTPLPLPPPGPAQFAQEIVIEEDRVLNLWVFGDDAEMYFLLDQAAVPSEALWRTNAPGRAAGSDLQICLDTQQDWLQRYFSVSAQFQSGTRVALGSSTGIIPPGQPPVPVITLCGTVPAAQVEPGDFTVVVTPLVPPGPPDGFEDKSPFVDRIVLRYQADYLASGDRLRCTSGGAAGPTAFSIAGFSGQPLLALDVTDPKAPAWFDLTGALAGNTLTLTDDVPAGSTRVYQVAPRAGIPMLAATDVEHDTPDPILDELDPNSAVSYDALVVAHDSFAADPKLLEWKAFRESQGVRIRIVRTSDAYDAFNGGLAHYDGIYQLVYTAYQNWGIAYVLLVGDGSEDAIRVRPTSGPNLVPDRLRYFLVTASGGGGNEYRNDLYERHYAKMGGEGDSFPDLLLGRWPVSDAQDLHNIVDKTLLYERPAAGDDGKWRKRVVLFSDDEWIRRNRPPTPGLAHIRGCDEWDFFRSVRRCCGIVNNAFPGDLHCVPFYLNEFSNKLADPPWNTPEHTAWPIDALPFPGYPQPCESNPNYTGKHVGSNEFQFYINPTGTALTDSIGEGALFFALQSHANRSQVTDEGVIRTRAFDVEAPFMPDFRNQGKPFVFFGFGCHLNEFGIPSEEASAEGDALGEVYLTVPSKGAVASYASTGYEFLGPNNRFHEILWSAIFNKDYARGPEGGAVDSDTLQSRWLLSALLQVGEISDGDPGIIDRQCLLGDPLLRLDAGVPRFKVVQLVNGILTEDGRIGALVPSDSVRVTVEVRDEQGIDSLWVEKRFRDGRRVPIPASIVAIAGVDTAAQIRAKRGYAVAFAVLFDTCDFDLAIGARDLSGRVSELYGRGQFEQQLMANGLPVENGSVVDARTAFRYVVANCVPDSTLDLAVFLDGQPVQGVSTTPDEHFFTWFADFGWSVAPGTHLLSFRLDGREIAALSLVVPGAFALRDVLAFPNPFADRTHFFFNLDSEISGGHVRITDLNGRTVRIFDLRAGALEDLRPEPVPGGGLGTTMALNYVEWDGTDSAGEQVANGVYFYDILITDVSGQEIRKRDKVVVMR